MRLDIIALPLSIKLKRNSTTHSLLLVEVGAHKWLSVIDIGQELAFWKIVIGPSNGTNEQQTKVNYELFGDSKFLNQRFIFSHRKI